MWDVLRWFSVFVIAVLVMVAGLYWILGKPLPIPRLGAHQEADHARGRRHGVGQVALPARALPPRRVVATRTQAQQSAQVRPRDEGGGQQVEGVDRQRHEQPWLREQRRPQRDHQARPGERQAAADYHAAGPLHRHQDSRHAAGPLPDGV